MKKVFVVFPIVSLIFACSKFSGSNPPPAPAPLVSDTDYCGPAETNLEKLCQTNSTANAYCCKVVALTALHKTFEQFCTETQNSGVFLNPKCLAAVVSCDQIDKCRSGL
jgi:hypothetical protein